MTQSQELYLKTKPSKLFMKAAIPGGISMLVSSLYQVFDSIFVGKFLGTTAFAALGLAMPLVIINFALGELVGVGSSVPISILLGKKEDKKANNYFTCSILLNMFLGACSGLLIYFVSPWFMTFMGADGKLAELGVQYVRVYAIASPIVNLTFAMDNYMRISGRIKTSMVMNIITSIGTVILELLFILVLEWGITGASFATVLSMALPTIGGLIIFATGKLQLKYVKPHFNREMLGHIMKNGTPAFLANASGRIFSIVMNIMLLKMGGEAAVAIYGVIMTIGAIVEMFLYGVLDSMQPSIGYNYGAERFDRVKAIEKYCVVTGATVAILGGMMIFLFPGQLAIPFLEDLSILDMAIEALKIASLAYMIKWVGLSIQQFLAAIEKPALSMAISLSSSCLFPLISIVILLPLDLRGLWLNPVLTAILTGLLAVTILLKQGKKLFIATDNHNRMEGNEV